MTPETNENVILQVSRVHNGNFHQVTVRGSGIDILTAAEHLLSEIGRVMRTPIPDLFSFLQDSISVHEKIYGLPEKQTVNSETIIHQLADSLEKTIHDMPSA